MRSAIIILISWVIGKDGHELVMRRIEGAGLDLFGKITR
jgi:hypothetical protein